MRLEMLLLTVLALLAAGACAPSADPAGPGPTPPVAASAAPAPSSPPPSSPSRAAEDRLRRVREVLVRAGEEGPGRTGLVYFDLEARKGVYLGEQAVFEAASLVKLPLLVELYRRADSGELDLDEELVFEERYRVGGSGVLKDREAGTRWSLAELARLMIVESDNAATDMIMDRLGGDSVEGAMTRLGLQHTTVRRHVFDFEEIDRGRDNLTSPLDVFRLLKGIADGTLPGAAAMREVLLGQGRRDMIPARLPAGTPVAHKTGELDGVLHDAGVVGAPGGSYVLVLMAQGFPDREGAVERWARLSEEVWKAHGPGDSES